MSLISPIGFFRTTLTGRVEESDTTIPIDSVVDKYGTSLNGLILAFVIDRGTAKEECVIGTVDAAGSQLTSVTRGVDPSDGATSRSTLKFAHGVTAPIEMTAFPYLTIAMSVLNGGTAFGGVPLNPSSRSISSARMLTDKEYVDAVAAGAGGISAFLVTQNGADPSLTVNVGAGYYAVDGVASSFAGASAQAVTNNATNYVQLSAAGAVVINTTGFLDGNLPLAIVVASGGDITSITDARPWISMPQVSKLIDVGRTYGATLSAGDPVRVDASASNKLIKALGTLAANADGFYGIALDAGVDTSTGKRVQTAGLYTAASGLTPDAPVYLTDAGGFSSSAGTYKKVVGWAVSATAFFILKSIRAEDIAGGNASLTTAIINEMATFFASTNITGAEAETLSDGSNADALHVHVNAASGSGTYNGTATNGTVNDDDTITCGFQPSVIEIDFYLQGHDSASGFADYQHRAGTVVFSGTTQKGIAPLNMSVHGGAEGANITAVAIDRTYFTSSTNPSAGVATGSGAVKITLLVSSVSSTGFVIRRQKVANEVNASVARADYVWRAYR